MGSSYCEEIKNLILEYYQKHKKNRPRIHQETIRNSNC